MNLLTRLFALHFDRSFSGKGWRQLAWLFGVIVTVFLLIYLVSFAFIFPEPSLEEWTGIDKGEFYQFNLSSCIRQQNSLTAQFVSFSLSNLANIF